MPVIRDADELTLAELSARSKALAEKARARQARPRRDERQHLHHLQHGHARRGELHRDHQSRRSAILAVSSTMMKPVVARRTRSSCAR